MTSEATADLFSLPGFLGRWRPGVLAGVAALVTCLVALLIAVSGVMSQPLARPFRAAAVFSNFAGFFSLLPFPAWSQYPAEIVTPDSAVGDAPNPFVIDDGGTYYMYSSQGNVYQSNIPTRTSTDLLHWSAPFDSMPTLPPWAKSAFTWSPDVHYVGGRYVMWFSALVRGLTNPTAADNGIECIGWATSRTPAGPFIPDPSPFSPICQASRFGSIDPHLFEAPDGTNWLYWKSDDNADVTSGTHSTIWVQRVASDGTDLVGQAVAFMTADQPYEGRIVEDGQMVYAAGSFWFFYSANWYNQPVYSIALARCSGPTGPCTKQGIWLNGNEQGRGTGESTVFEDRKGQWWIAYAPWSAVGSTYTPRPVAMARLGFLSTGPYLAAP